MKKIKSRSAGVLMALSSLPGKYGCGDFGESAYRFIDFAKKAGFRLWQLLPLNPLGYGHSPYQPFSSNAMSDLYLSLDALVKEKLLDEVPPFRQDSDRVDFEAVSAFRLPYLKAAFAKAKKKGYSPRSFLARNRWVKNWAYFMMNKRRFGCSWDQWPEENKKWIDGPRRIKKKDREDYEFEIWLQEKLAEQFAKLRAYAKKNNILLMGDMPFYVGYDSNDVYANKDQFLLDGEARPTSVAGVPPDYFSPTGQRWGNPIYDWDKLIKSDYRFFVDRVGYCGKMFDLVRLDHFRAFDTYWKIPASEETAMVGEWIEAPGKEFFTTLLKKYPDLDIIAEDLGDLRPEVLQLRDLFEFPGMNVIEFTFPDQIFAKKDGFDEPNSVCYLGTHDNETIVGFIKDTLKEEDAKKWDEELVKLGYTEGDLAHKLIRFCLDKKCILAVLSVQDILGLDNVARTNKPGFIDDFNWTWRMKDFEPLEAKIPEVKALLAGSKR